MWCPRKDLNLQPPVCRTSALSIELLGREMVVGVGIEPTFRAFQTRANPSQLSDRKHCRLPIFDCRFEYTSFQSAIGIRQSTMRLSTSFTLHLFHDLTVIVDIHEEVLEKVQRERRTTALSIA